MKKLNFKKGLALKVSKGFTLIELLVVIAIIGVLASIIIVTLNNGQTRGKNAGVKSNLANARTQAQVFYNTNSVANLTFTNVCNNGPVGTPPVQGIGSAVLAAAKITGLTAVGSDTGGSTSTATCNDSAGAWAAEAPLVGGGMWCVDSTNKSVETSGTSLSSGTDYTCN
jgi:prepilin-type N-terminal cleavage/methylation domain-containing protein